MTHVKLMNLGIELFDCFCQYMLNTWNNRTFKKLLNSKLKLKNTAGSFRTFFGSKYYKKKNFKNSKSSLVEVYYFNWLWFTELIALHFE